MLQKIFAIFKSETHKLTGRQLHNNDLLVLSIETSAGVNIDIELSFYDHSDWLSSVKSLADVKCKAITSEHVYMTGIAGVRFAKN